MALAAAGVALLALGWIVWAQATKPKTEPPRAHPEHAHCWHHTNLPRIGGDGYKCCHCGKWRGLVDVTPNDEHGPFGPRKWELEP